MKQNNSAVEKITEESRVSTNIPHGLRVSNYGARRLRHRS